MENPQWESAFKVTLAAFAVVALFAVIGTGSWGAESGFAPTERSNSQYDEFAMELFVGHGFELVLMALIIAAAVLGGLQIAREEDYE